MEALGGFHEDAVADFLVLRNERRELITIGFDALYRTPEVILIHLFDIGFHADLHEQIVPVRTIAVRLR